MFAISIDVRTDVLRAFESSLTEGESRNDLIGALIQLESQCRRTNYISADGYTGLGNYSVTNIELDLDLDDDRALRRGLRPAEDRGSFITALMIGSVCGQIGHTARADEAITA